MHIDIHFAGHLDPTVNLVVPGQQWLHDHYHKPYHRESGFIMIAVPGRQWRNFDAVLIIIMTSIIMIQKKTIAAGGPLMIIFIIRAPIIMIVVAG